MMAAASPKKRKRKADSDRGAPSPAGPRPSGKKGRAAAPGRVSVSVSVAPDDPAVDPVVVSFPRGVPGSLAVVAADGGSRGDDADEASAGGAPDPPRFVCSRPKAKSSRGRRVTGEDGRCSYAASARGRGHDGRLTKAYVCVYDRRKKTLRLVPAAERGTVFALEQTVKGYEPSVADGSMVVGSGRTEDGDGAVGGAMSASDQVQMLVESFGSKKKQKVMASRAANRVNIDSVVGAGDVMMHSVANQEGISSENKRELEGGEEVANPNDVAYEAARRKMLPPYDANADAPHKVYNAQTIMGRAAWDKVSRLVEKLLAKREEGVDAATSLLGKKGFRPPSVVTLVNSIDRSKKGASLRINAAFFLAMAMKFRHRMQRRGVVEGASLDDCISSLNIPHEVGTRLFELFATARDGGGYVVSKMQRDRMNAHLLILYVIACGRSMDVDSVNGVCRDMKLDAKEASLVLREAGFAVRRNGAREVGVKLSVPLKFPPPRRGKKT